MKRSNRRQKRLKGFDISEHIKRGKKTVGGGVGGWGGVVGAQTL